MSGFTCGPCVYEYKGVKFEMHSWCGPAPLDKKGNPKAPNRAFYLLYEEFKVLSKEEKESCFVTGGCQRF